MKKTIQQFNNIAINSAIIKKINKKTIILTGTLILLLTIVTSTVGLNGYFGGAPESEYNNFQVFPLGGISLRETSLNYQ